VTEIQREVNLRFVFWHDSMTGGVASIMTLLSKKENKL